MTTFVDFYAQCKSGLITRLLTLTELFPKNWQVSSNDADLKRGAEYFMILKPGAFIESGQGYEKQIEWHTTGNLYVRFAEYQDVPEIFDVARAKIIHVIKSDDSLGGTSNVHGTGITAPEPPQFYWHTRAAAESGALPNFVTQPFDIAITQLCKFE